MNDEKIEKRQNVADIVVQERKSTTKSKNFSKNLHPQKNYYSAELQEIKTFLQEILQERENTEKTLKQLLEKMSQIEKYLEIPEKIEIFYEFLNAIEKLKEELYSTGEVAKNKIEDAGTEGIKTIQKSFEEYISLIIGVQDKILSLNELSMNYLQKELQEHQEENTKNKEKKNKWTFFTIGIFILGICFIAFKIKSLLGK
ncbi:hypothetical protein IX329_001017 [Fusobacterium necrophorum]|nr:hypothetical protein [Fusobacterium necrophorum]MBR8733443.1 hypothetical protein [Fusobacterium necrophorum]MBR8789620.1 hypothetical protein [Fusobacterium necrophorum]MCF0163439.1 hypothetical protein [Fusobacterium necrophorum]